MAADHNHAWNDDDALGGAAGNQRGVKIAFHSAYPARTGHDSDRPLPRAAHIPLLLCPNRRGSAPMLAVRGRHVLIRPG
jgi:hypothetical protein